MELEFDDRGLLTAVVQDAASGEVLMVAWMNAESLRLTRETGDAWFWSRSRGELWRKGATSGSLMRVREILADCDGDTLLLIVDPAGPACHTGERTCFFTKLEGAEGTQGTRMFSLRDLDSVILDRKANPKAGSYTASLFAAGEDEIVKKVGEEAVEIILAAKGQGDERLIAEAADLFYHTLVLFAARGLSLADVEAELERRHGRPPGAPPLARNLRQGQ